MVSLFKKSKTSNAFSFGEECVRFVSLEMTKQGVCVTDHATIDLAGVVSADGIILDDERFVLRAREFSKSRELVSANVVAPDSSAIFFHTHVAEFPTRHMNDVISDHLKTYCEAHDLLGFDEYVCEYEIVHETNFGCDVHVTLVLKSTLTHMAHLFKQAGITIAHVETAHHAVAKTCVGMPIGSGYIAVSVGNKKTTIAIVHGEHLVSHDIVNVGIDSIARAIEKRLRVSHDDAEKIILRHGIMPSHPDKTVLSEIHQSLYPIVQSIDAQIVSSLEKQYKLFCERFSIEKIIVYGEGLSVRGLVDYLGHATRLSAVALDVWADSKIPHAQIMNLPASDVPVYAEVLSMGILYLK